MSQPVQPTTNEYLDEEAKRFITNKWSRTIIQPILIALMTTAFFTCVFVIARNFAPRLPWSLLTPLIFIVTLEGIFTTTWLASPDRRTLNHTYYRISEFLVILLVTRIYIWLIIGNWPHFTLFGDYLRYPWILFNDGLFIFAMIGIVASWFYARITSKTFNELALDEAEVTYYAKPLNKRDMGNQPVTHNRHELTESFFIQWMWGGSMLVIFVAIATIDLPTVTLTDEGLGLSRLGLSPMIVLGVLVYFLAGLALLSEARLETLNARWLHLNAQKKPQVERAWHQYGIWFLVIVGVVAAFLPLGSTLLIGQLVEQILLIITGIISLIGYFFVLFFSFLFSPLMAGVPTPIAATPPPAVPTPAATPIPTVPPVVSDTPAMLASSLFWAIAIVGLIMAFSFFLRGRGVRLNGRIFKDLWNSVRFFLSSLWGGITDQLEEIGEALQLRLRSDGEVQDGEDDDSRRPFRFFRINSLSPQEQVRYFYLSTLKRAQNQGIARETNETPLEFMDDLKESWPEAEEEIDTLTEAFLKARYSPRAIEKEEVNPVKEKWKRAKSSLRKRAQKKDAP